MEPGVEFGVDFVGNAVVVGTDAIIRKVGLLFFSIMKSIGFFGFLCATNKFI